MAIFYGKDAIRLMFGSEVVQTLWIGVVTAYQAARACFSAKLWRPARPWIYNEKWKM